MPIANRPGLTAVSYRTGTYATFFETMVARLSNLSIGTGEFDSAGNEITVRPLDRLTTRAQSDPAIALLDAWAVVGDVLTFYDERIAQEGYLRTASERRSVLELARLIGYAPRPGVSATAYLAYTIDEDRSVTPPKGMEVVIPAGSRAQSVPEPNELPQTFETAEPLRARTQWNKLQPRMSVPQTPESISSGELWLKGTATNLKPSDAIITEFEIGLETGAKITRTPWRVAAVEPQVLNDRTKITLRSWLNPQQAITSVVLAAEGHAANTISGAKADEARAALATLSERTAALSNDPIGLATIIETETLPKLQKLHASTNSRARKLEPWLREMAGEFTTIHANLLSAGAGSVANSSPKPGQIDPLFKALTRAPATLPPTPAQLGRTLDTAFKTGGDVFTRALAKFQPRLAGVLGPAVANASVAEPARIKVYALRSIASFFGHNAPAQPIFKENGEVQTFTEPTLANTWRALAVDSKDLRTIALDAEYPQIQPKSLMLIDRPEFGIRNESMVPAAQTIVDVENVASATLAGLGISAKVTEVTIVPTAPEWIPTSDKIIRRAKDDTGLLRGTRIYAQSELLALADLPITDRICDAAIELDGLYDGLETGRWVILAGERADVFDNNCKPIPGIHSAELGMILSVSHGVRPNEEVSAEQPKIDAVSNPAASLDAPLPESVKTGYGQTTVTPRPSLPGDKIHTFLTLSTEPAYCYVRETLTIYGNVVKATHGETRREVLGSGDASKPLQSFTLRQPPLTFVPAPTAAGAASTLVVRVNEVQWHEADSLAGLSPNDRQFITKTDDESKTTVVFGNGARGARPPTGRDNIIAVYRNGIGRAGNVKPNQISQLGTRPLGVKEVINPLRASGGADREARDQIRRNAPLGILALDRLVSVQDYADFARTFAGIGKASATRLSDGTREIICLTIAGADDIPIDQNSDLYKNLVQALRDLGDPHLIIELKVRELRALLINAQVAVLPDYAWEFVEPKIRAALLDTFSFERRELGQDVTTSEVISAIQRVPGVAFVDLDVLTAISEAEVQDELLKSLAGAQPAKNGPSTFVSSLAKTKPRLCVEPARTDFAAANFKDRIRAAQLAVLSAALPETLLLTEAPL